MSTPSPGQPNPYAPPKAAVQDIVEPHSGELATRLSRLLAYIVDVLILGFAVGLPVGITAGFAAAAKGVSRSTGGTLGPFDPKDFLGIGGLISLIAVIVWIVITIRLVHANGQSIGKRILGIKVVRKDGSRASLGRIFWLRNFVAGLPGSILGRVLPSLAWVYSLVDCLMIFSESRQCLHDKIADTIVVKA